MGILREQVEQMTFSEAEHIRAQEDLKAEHAKAQRSFDAEHAEAQKINEDLLHELERREEAIGEAVAIICQLEEKIEKLELPSMLLDSSTTAQHVRLENLSNKDTLPQLESTASASGPKTPEADPACRDNTLSAIKSSDSLRKSTRTTPMLHKTPFLKPSFLKSDNGSAGTLRSLYLEGENVLRESPKFASTTRPLSLLSRDDDENSAKPEDYYRMRTPPLSILSKSSFQSIYGTPEGPLIGLPVALSNDLEIQPRSIKQDKYEAILPERRKTFRIQKWMDDKESPLRNRHISPRRGFTEPIVSIESLLGKEELTNEQSSSRPNETTEPVDNATVPPSLGTLCTTIESLRDGTPTLAPSHLSQEESPRPPSADSYASEFAHIELSFGIQGWFGTPRPQPDESSSIGEAEPGLYHNNYQDSPELPGSWSGMVVGRVQETSSAAADLVSHGNNMLFNDDDNLPTENRTQLPYKSHPRHGGNPPRTTRNVSQLSDSEIHPADRITEAESPRARNLEQTPSPHQRFQDLQGLEDPEAQQYQRLITPPSDPKRTMTLSDTESKLPHVSSVGTTSSSLSVTPLLPARPKYTYSIFPRSQSQSIKARDTQQESFPFTQRQSLDVNKLRTGISSTAPSLLPQAPRTPLHQQAPPSRIARFGTAGSAPPQRASSSVITRRETPTFSTGTTTSGEEGFLTPSTNSHDESAAETPSHVGKRQGLQNERAGSQTPNLGTNEGTLGRKWGAKLGRTASLKIKQSFGWKKGLN